MNVDQSPPQVSNDTAFAGVIEVQKAQNEVMEAIARFLGARPVGNAITIGGGDIPGLGTDAGGDALLERTEIIANLDIRGLSFSDAASIMSLARDPAPAASQTTNHDSALLGATIAAQSSLAEHARTGTDHAGVLTDYYAANV